MGFHYPAMLWWLFAALIPVVIHLFNFRRHKVLLFSNIELLKNLHEQTNKTNQIKHLVVLISRILAIISLILVFAQPYYRTSDTTMQSGKKVVSIYLDNSLSMQRRNENSTFFEDAQRKAMDLISGFDLNTRFVLITNEFQAKHNRLLSRSEFKQELAGLSAGTLSADLGNVIKRNSITTKNEEDADRYLFLLTDFQESVTQWNNLPADSSIRLILVPAGSSKDQNIFVDTIWIQDALLQKGREAALKVRIHNDGAQDVFGIPVKLEINGKQMALTNVDVSAGSSTTIDLQFLVPEEGFHQGIVSLQDYPLIFDDELFFSFNAIPTINVLEIYEDKPENSLQVLFENRPDITFVSNSKMKLDLQSLSDYQLVIVNQLTIFSSGMLQAFENFLKAGGSIVLVPGEGSAEPYNSISKGLGFSFGPVDTTQTRIIGVEERHPFFKNVFVRIPDNADFPIVRKHLPLNLSASSQASSVIRLLQGDAFVVLSELPEGGKVYAFASSFDPKWSNLTRNQLFVPLIYRMIYRSPSLHPLYYLPDESGSVEIAWKGVPISEKLSVSDDSGQLKIIPVIAQSSGGNKLIVTQLLNRSAHYLVTSSDSVINVFSVNLSRKESYLRVSEESALEKTFKDKGFKQVETMSGQSGRLGQELTGLTQGKSNTWIFVIMALCWLLLEGIILRYWK